LQRTIQQQQKKKVPIPLSSSYTCVRDDDKGIDTTPFPAAQGSSSVTDASAHDVILNDKKRKLLDVEEDNDEVEDDNEKEEATTITTPSKSEVAVVRTSSRGRPIGSGKKGFSSPQLIISVHETFSISSNVLSLSV
jgi:hypothetical protein